MGEEVIIQTAWNVIGMGVSIGVLGAGLIAAVLKWSLGRNLADMDKKITVALEKIDTLYQMHEGLRREVTLKTDCASCRRECQERLTLSNQSMITWMQRLEDKLERLIMMIANLNNGQGGVTNGRG